MKQFIAALVVIGLATSVVISQGTGTPSTLRVRTDANGYLMSAGAAQTPPYVTSTFANTRLKTDANGNLLVASTGGIAPADAQYWVGAADSTLSAEKNLGALATGLVVNTTGTPTAYTGTSCTNQFPRSLSAVGAATCASVAATDFGTQGPYTVLMNATGSTATPTFTNSPIWLANGIASGAIFKPKGRIYWENTNAVTTAGSVVPAFGSVYSLPAGTMGTNGDRLYIRVSVTLGNAATDNKNLQCNLGYSAFNSSTGAFTGGVSVIAESSASNTGSVSWYVEGIVTRTGATNTAYEWQSKWGSNATTQGANYTTDSGGITWANANNFLCAVYNITASNTQTLRLNMYDIEWQPYHP